MQHFPIFLSVSGRRVVVSGGGAAAMAKLRLLFKTEARLTVIAADPAPEIEVWAAQGRLTLVRREVGPGDGMCAALFYAAHDDDAADARAAALARADGATVNMVDNLAGSDFITPAIVDRDPVTVAVGTEGAAPVLARQIKADLEARLPASLGPLARIAKGLRGLVDALPAGRARRAFWSDYYDRVGPAAIATGEDAVRPAFDAALDRHKAAQAAPGQVVFVGAGPGDPELLTLKARRWLDTADVVVHDRLVPGAILELARREAEIVDMGKTGFGPSTPQADIEAMIVDRARAGLTVVRLKGGDPAVFARLEEEIDALDAAGIDWQVVPGITAASAAAAATGRSLTRRGRNAGIRFLTGHDTAGFADHDWAALARPGEVAAVYMGKRAARFLQGRLMMHGAAPDTPVTVVENAGRPGTRTVATTLARLEPALSEAGLSGPALILLGLATRMAHGLAKHSNVSPTRFQQAQEAL